MDGRGELLGLNLDHIREQGSHQAIK